MFSLSVLFFTMYGITAGEGRERKVSACGSRVLAQRLMAMIKRKVSLCKNHIHFPPVRSLCLTLPAFD
jgi:hypothetical protein